MSDLNKKMNLYAISSSTSGIDQWITVALFSSSESDKKRFHELAVDEFKKLAVKMGFEIVGRGNDLDADDGLEECNRCESMDEIGFNGLCPTCSDDMGANR